VGAFPAAIPVRRRFGAAKNSGGSGCFFASFAVVLMQKCQKSWRRHYRPEPAHLAERRDPKRRDDIIDIAYSSIHNM
jgi:hypothetical protein